MTGDREVKSGDITFLGKAQETNYGRINFYNIIQMIKLQISVKSATADERHESFLTSTADCTRKDVSVKD